MNYCYQFRSVVLFVAALGHRVKVVRDEVKKVKLLRDKVKKVKVVCGKVKKVKLSGGKVTQCPKAELAEGIKEIGYKDKLTLSYAPKQL